MKQEEPAAIPHYALVDLDFGDGRYPFKLGFHEASSAETELDKGVFKILNEIKNGEWRQKDLRGVIRWALIGGGLTPVEAEKKVKLYVDQRPADENCALAMQILAALFFGSPEYQQRQQTAG
ncbi:gene transfer agent family protein [Tianweitania sp. BSSL-BM11]|uniref:Gene transfer agent family protein n=1 Tax=Tianweitania aestuarii TaxID=2814886 RepID=A0ABS5RT53_9HYPH|nr:gene transfer agent family protein [Tianweitania aestuarii]MBS9720235.1 gene transfer agent family protein [Tianweitania aestuarii]